MKWTDLHGMPRATNDEWNTQEVAAVDALQRARDELDAVSARIADSARTRARWSDADIKPLLDAAQDLLDSLDWLRESSRPRGAVGRYLFEVRTSGNRTTECAQISTLRAALAKFAEADMTN